MANFIDTIQSNMRTTGLAMPNRWVALFKPNSYVVNKYLNFEGAGFLGVNTITQRLSTTCFSATLPSKSFFTHDFQITSPKRKIPYAINSSNESGASFEFYCLSDYFEKEIFQQWMNGIIPHSTRDGRYAKMPDYYDNYTKGSEIILVMIPNGVRSLEQVLEFLSNPTTYQIPGIRFNEVYPYNISINGGAVTYDAASKPMTVKVDFMFREVERYEDISIVNDTTAYSQNVAGPYQREVVNVTLADANRDFREMKRREARIDLQYKVLRTGLGLLSSAQGFGILG